MEDRLESRGIFLGRGNRVGVCQADFFGGRNEGRTVNFER